MLDSTKETTKQLSEETLPITGIVTDCMWANIYANPSEDSDLVNVMSCLTDVVIDKDRSTDRFYKIVTENGVIGFCKKKFIAVRQ